MIMEGSQCLSGTKTKSSDFLDHLLSPKSLLIPSQVLNVRVRNREPEFPVHAMTFLTLSKPISVDVAQARDSVIAATRRQRPQLHDYIRRRISCLPTNEEYSSRGGLESKELPGHSAMTIRLDSNPR